jgi:hypothetical protein
VIAVAEATWAELNTGVAELLTAALSPDTRPLKL